MAGPGLGPSKTDPEGLAPREPPKGVGAREVVAEENRLLVFLPSGSAGFGLNMLLLFERPLLDAEKAKAGFDWLSVAFVLEEAVAFADLLKSEEVPPTWLLFVCNEPKGFD